MPCEIVLCALLAFVSITTIATAQTQEKKIEKSEIRAEIKKDGDVGRIVKLEHPLLAYEAELVKGGERDEIQVAPDRKIVEALKWFNPGEKTD